jgi:hypothetical protein
LSIFPFPIPYQFQNHLLFLDLSLDLCAKLVARLAINEFRLRDFEQAFRQYPQLLRNFHQSEKVDEHRKDLDMDRSLMLLELNKMRYRVERLKHVPVKTIYSKTETVR